MVSFNDTYKAELHLLYCKWPAAIVNSKCNSRMPFEQEFGAFGQLATSPAGLHGLAQVRFSSCCLVVCI